MNTVSKTELTMTANELFNTLSKKNRTQKISVTHRKSLDMYKRDNPFFGRVEVVQTLHGQINTNYSRSVQTVTGDDLFKAQKRSWGKRIEKSPLVTHKDKSYLELKVDRKIVVCYYIDGIQETNKNNIMRIESFLKPERDEVVSVRNIPLSQILKLKLGGKTYRVARS